MKKRWAAINLTVSYRVLLHHGLCVEPEKSRRSTLWPPLRFAEGWCPVGRGWDWWKGLWTIVGNGVKERPQQQVHPGRCCEGSLCLWLQMWTNVRYDLVVILYYVVILTFLVVSLTLNITVVFVCSLYTVIYLDIPYMNKVNRNTDACTWKHMNTYF